MEQGKFKLDIRKKFFTERVVKHWNRNRLPREFADALFLEIFKRRKCDTCLVVNLSLLS